MKKSNLAIALAIALVSLCTSANLPASQRHSTTAIIQDTATGNYAITIVFPASYDYEKVAYLIDDGKGYGQKVTKANKQITQVKGKAYSAYVKLKLKLLHQETQVIWAKADQTARIVVNEQEELQLEHAFMDEDMGASDLATYLAPYQQDLQAFFKENKAAIDQGGDAIQRAVTAQIDKILYAKLDYVKSSEYKYIAFEVFKNDLLTSSLPSTVLEEVYQSSFPSAIKGYWDAKQVEHFLAGKNLVPGAIIPTVNLVDIDGEALVIAKDQLSKMTLIQFWASWCSFCIAEMPNIKRIHKAYAATDHLEMVSISLDQDAAAFNRAREQYHMDWRHVYGDANAAKSFGFTALPSIVLIGKDGTILFRKEGMRSEDDFEALKHAIDQSIKL
ncbi:MAG: TlpA disulfide reductase family protein [Bacteroidota bacterium]